MSEETEKRAARVRNGAIWGAGIGLGLHFIPVVAVLPILLPMAAGAAIAVGGTMAAERFTRPRFNTTEDNSYLRVLKVPHEMGRLADQRQHEADHEARRSRLAHERQLLELTAGALLVTKEAEDLSARKDLRILHEKDMAALELQRVKDADAIRLEMLKRGVVLPHMEYKPKHPAPSRWEKATGIIKNIFGSKKPSSKDQFNEALSTAIAGGAAPSIAPAEPPKAEKTETPDAAAKTTAPPAPEPSVNGPVINNFNIAFDDGSPAVGMAAAAGGMTERQATNLIYGFMTRPEVQQVLAAELSAQEKLDLLKPYLNDQAVSPSPVASQTSATTGMNEADMYTMQGRSATVETAGARALQAYLSAYLTTQQAEPAAALQK